METEWDWQKNNKGCLLNKNNLKKEGKENEIWRIWWGLCTTRLK